MRIIKFRAWDTKRKVMQGDAEATPDNSYENGFADNVVCLNSIIELTQDQDQILMQFTGLKDKNGLEVYEGDYLLAKDWGQKERFMGPVKFQITEFVVMYHKLNNKTWTQLTALAEPGNLDEWEVIGNIYENPELLEDSK